jgi:hypothetical protein
MQFSLKNQSIFNSHQPFQLIIPIIPLRYSVSGTYMLIGWSNWWDVFEIILKSLFALQDALNNIF